MKRKAKRGFSNDEDTLIVRARNRNVPWSMIAKTLNRSINVCLKRYQMYLENGTALGYESSMQQAAEYRESCNKYSEALSKVYGFNSKPFSDTTSRTSRQPLTYK